MMESTFMPEDEPKIIRTVVIDRQSMFIDLVSMIVNMQENIVIVGAFQSLNAGTSQLRALNPDVLIIDLYLLDSEICSRLRTLFPNIGIIALGYLNSSYEQAVQTLGCTAYLDKAHLVKGLTPMILDVSHNTTNGYIAS